MGEELHEKLAPARDGAPCYTIPAGHSIVDFFPLPPGFRKVRVLPKPLSHGIVLLNRVQLPIQARALNFSHLSHGEREVSIERGDVEKIAYLARIQVTESELDKVTADLSRILNLVDQMGAVSTEGVEPLSNPLDMVQRL